MWITNFVQYIRSMVCPGRFILVETVGVESWLEFLKKHFIPLSEDMTAHIIFVWSFALCQQIKTVLISWQNKTMKKIGKLLIRFTVVLRAKKLEIKITKPTFYHIRCFVLSLKMYFLIYTNLGGWFCFFFVNPKLKFRVMFLKASKQAKCKNI